ncbi:MAG: fasciclin domain-containing protein [Geobacteraceae bacterium]|nr:fasciclin domain-containing protein [Geobacteraceae bacterium]
MADIVETIRNEASLGTLLALLEKSGVMETLKGTGPYTLFAPNDEAFSRMNIIEYLTDMQNLSDTLTYHIAAGRHTADDIRDRDAIGTENGKYLTVTLDEGDTVVDNGKFVAVDIECSNGIIHIIDNVFQPQLSGWYRDE